jgi:hypothetical protein
VVGRLKQWWRKRGALPEELRAELEAEGIELLEEGLRGTVLFRGYVILGQRPRSGHQNVTATLALTGRRLLVHGTGTVRLEAPRGAEWLEHGLAAPDQLRLAYDAAAAYPQRAGEVELLLSTPRAKDLHARLQAWMSSPSS